jgi:serine/threonine protein kinase
VISATLASDPRVRVAIKVMKPLSTYIQYVCDAKKEAQLLHLLRETYKLERSSNAPLLCRSLHMEDAFPLRRGDEDYMCLMFEHCDCTLYDLVRSNGFMGLHVGVVQSIALQCLQQLQRVHALGYTHTDIKHKNVMFVRENTLSITKREHWPVQVQATANRSATTYRHPVECMVRIIDYGNSTHASESHNTTVHTKQFRAPEILLQCFPWTTASDLWCLGCTLYFAYNGDLLFNSHDRGQLVSMISAVLGGVPPHMLSGFNVQPVTGTVQDLHSRIHPTHRVFAEFLSTLLCVDPAKRSTAEEALRHPFFQAQF